MNEPRDGYGLLTWVREARARSLTLIDDLSDEQLIGPMQQILNPMLWEIGHVAWFQERWVLRHALGREPIRADQDEFWDSGAVEHDTRWDLALPPRDETLAYCKTVHDSVSEVLDRSDPSPALRDAVLLCVFHEDMHSEAFTYMRQTLEYPAPSWFTKNSCPPIKDRAEGDAEVPGGTFMLGALDSDGFVFDNERAAHEVRVDPFRIARVVVTEGEFERFVRDGGYGRQELWSSAGLAWLAAKGVSGPLYWRLDGDTFERRSFDEWRPLVPDHPMMYVSWHEAQAYCKWAERRLPTEVEWEVAAAGERDGNALGGAKRVLPWGSKPALPDRSRVCSWGGGPCSVHAYAEGDSAFGCRQMIGNVWEWTDSTFEPYPGFEKGVVYPDYSAPWFTSRKVLRGGAWTTRGRMLRNTWRNFYQPGRRDVLSGFRTCAL